MPRKKYDSAPSDLRAITFEMSASARSSRCGLRLKVALRRSAGIFCGCFLIAVSKSDTAFSFSFFHYVVKSNFVRLHNQIICVYLCLSVDNFKNLLFGLLWKKRRRTEKASNPSAANKPEFTRNLPIYPRQIQAFSEEKSVRRLQK